MKISKLEAIRSQSRKSQERNEEQQLKQVKAIEIILTNHTEISIKTFENYEFVQSVIIIDTALSCIHPDSFQSISQSLICLNLSQQHLTDMSFLQNHNLPFLKDLFLNDNDINEISDLSACRNLRLLSLSSNKISDLQNAELHYLGDLRELCLQSNLITQIKDLQCYNLKSLHLASNPIYNLQDIDDNLVLLPLKHISFQDIHFGACPVTKEIKFRQNLIKKLPQVSFIDMIEVTGEDRHQQNLVVTDFNDQVEDIYNNFEKEVGYIDEEKKFQLRDLNVPENITDMISKIEAHIKHGLNDMYEDVQRSIEVKNEKREELETRLLSISKSYANKVDKQIKKENELKEMEQIKFDKIKQMKSAEYAHASFASRVEKKYFKEHFSLSYLDKNSDDYHWVDLCFRNSQDIPYDNIDNESLQSQRLSVQQCYCFLRKTQVEENQLDNSLQKFYLHGTENYLDSVFESNVTKLCGDYSNDQYQHNDEFVFFYSNPLRAVKLKSVENKEFCSSMNRTEDKETFLDDSSFLFIEYNLMNNHMSDSSIKKVSLQHAPKSENELISEMKSEIKDGVVNFTFGEVRKESIIGVRILNLNFLINNNMIKVKHGILGGLEDSKNFTHEHKYVNKQASSTKIKQQSLDFEIELGPKPIYDDYESNFLECMEKVRLEYTKNTIGDREDLV